MGGDRARTCGRLVQPSLPGERPRAFREGRAAKRVLRALHGQFGTYTLARVIENERACPDDHPFVVAGRERFHEGLRRAGLT